MAYCGWGQYLEDKVLLNSISLQRVRCRVRSIRGYFSTVRPLVKLVWQASPYLFLTSFGLTLFVGLVPAANIFITSSLLDVLVQEVRRPAGNDSALPTDFVVLLALLAVVNLLEQVFEQLAQVISRLHGARITNHVQMLIAAKASEIDLASFEDPDFHNRMTVASNEAPHRPKMIIDELLGAVSMLTTLASLTTVLLVWHAWIVPIILVASLATLWVSTHFGTAMVRLVNRRAETERKQHYLSALFVSDQVVKEMRLFNLRDFLLNKFQTLLETIYQQNRSLAFNELGYSLPASLILGLVQVALIGFTALQALQGAISIGQFNLYTQSIIQVAMQIPGLMFAIGMLHESNLFAAGLFGFLATQPQVEAPRLGAKASSSAISQTPQIEFRDVSFVYPGTVRPVLDRVSFKILPGEAIALVGENGAGKSSLVKLLAGLYEPTEGQILLDGININTLNRDDLRAYLSVIFQDYVIYHFSARENIGVGQVDKLDDFHLVENSAQLSGLDKIIDKLPEEYETVLGRFWESGHELSGGQRQLVALARALFRDAPILMLDEPSAALDVYTERRFFQRLLEGRTVERPKTVIFISHRFTTVRRADRIFVLENGRLIEQGTHKNLLAKGEHYADMFNLQAAMYSIPDSPTKTPDEDTSTSDL